MKKNEIRFDLQFRAIVERVSGGLRSKDPEVTRTTYQYLEIVRVEDLLFEINITEKVHGWIYVWMPGRGWMRVHQSLELNVDTAAMGDAPNLEAAFKSDRDFLLEVGLRVASQTELGGRGTNHGP